LFSVKALSLVFRGKFVELMKAAYKKDELFFPGILAPFEKPGRFKQLVDSLYGKKWVVYIREPIDRPEFVIKYLGRYTHRVAISNQRIVSLKEGMVTFTYKNRDTDKICKETIPAVEFIRRFLLHSLPKRFVRVRHYGYLSSRNKKKHLSQIRKIMGVSDAVTKRIEKSVQEVMIELTGVDIMLCPCCKKGKMRQFREIPIYTGQSAYDVIRPPNLRMIA
jgi:hypothetical protein